MCFKKCVGNQQVWQIYVIYRANIMAADALVLVTWDMYPKDNDLPKGQWLPHKDNGFPSIVQQQMPSMECDLYFKLIA